MLSEAWLSHGKVDLALTSIGLFRASTTTREPFTRSLLTNKTGSGLINEILRCQLPPLCVLFSLHTKHIVNILFTRIYSQINLLIILT